MRRAVLTAVVALAFGGLGLVASGCSTDEPGPGGELRLPGPDPTTLDPHKVRDVSSAEYIYEIFSGLVTVGPDLKPAPDLAEAWAVSDSGTTYMFTLRDGIRFHDGRPVTAKDVVASFQRACGPDLDSLVVETYLGDIEGCLALRRGETDALAGVRAVDENRVSITIDAPKAYFLAKLTYPTAFVVDVDQLAADPDWIEAPNATGPFRLTAFEPGNQVVLEASRHYHGPGPFVETVHFDLTASDSLTRYENGELDASPVSPVDRARVMDPLNPLHHEVVESDGDMSVTYLAMDVTRPPFDDPEFRRAVYEAVNRDRLAEVVLRGAAVPLNGILPPGMPGYHPEVAPLGYDPAGARERLGAAGAAEALDGPVVLTVSGSGGADPVAQAVADDLAEHLGIEVVLQQSDWVGFQEGLDAHAFTMWSLGWAADYPDPHDFLDLLFHSRSTLNDTGYDNRQVDTWLEAARIEQDPQDRLELYGRAEAAILGDAPWVPLYTGRDTWVVKPYVSGFDLPAIVAPRLAGVRMAN